MNTITTLLLLLLAGFISTGVFAEEPDAAANRVEQRLAKLQEKLELSDQQVEQVRPILEQGAKRRQEVFASYGFGSGDGAEAVKELEAGDKRKLGKELRAVARESHDQLTGVLTEPQMELYKKVLEEQRQAIRQRSPGQGR